MFSNNRKKIEGTIFFLILYKSKIHMNLSLWKKERGREKKIKSKYSMGMIRGRRRILFLRGTIDLDRQNRVQLRRTTTM